MRIKSMLHFRGVVSAFLFFRIIPAFSCGIYYFGEEYRISFLNPYVVGGDYAPFFYSADYLNAYEGPDYGADRSLNCREWAAALGNGIDEGQVREVLYEGSLDNLLNAIEDGAENKRYLGNLFFQTLLKPEKKDILEYLVFAKRYEFYANYYDPDPWGYTDYETAPRADQQLHDLKVLAQERLNKTDDPFLKKRYAYQLLVMSRYDGDRSAFMELYKQYFEQDLSSALSGWALHHRAAMEPDPVRRTLLYALSFARNPEKAINAYLTVDKEMLAKALGLAENNRQKAALYAMAEVKNPGRSLQGIQQIYNLDPQNGLLGLLLVREINKLENWILGEKLTGFEPVALPYNADITEETAADRAFYRSKNLQKDLVYLAQFQDFISTMLKGHNNSVSQDLLRLFNAHTCMMLEKAGEAGKYLREMGTPESPVMAMQKAREELLLLLYGEDINAPEVQERMAQLFTGLSPHIGDTPQEKRDFKTLHLAVSQKYRDEGNLPLAYFFFNYSLDIPHTFSEGIEYVSSYYNLIGFLDWRATPADIDGVLTILDQQKKTRFQDYLMGAPMPSRNALLDLKGTLLFRKGDLQAAEKAFAGVDQDFWTTRYEFANNLRSDPFWIFELPKTGDSFPDTKTAFVRRMIDLKAEAESDPGKAAEDYLKLGVAWYNCTWFGHSWMMFRYGNSINDTPENLPEGQEEAARVYFSCSRAEDYLKKAAAATKDPELLAKIALVNAKIQENRVFLATDYPNLWWREPEAQAAAAKQMKAPYDPWQKQYSETDYYKWLTGACDELATYLGEK